MEVMSAREAAEAGSPAERQGAGQGESKGFGAAAAEPLAGGTGTKQTNGTTPHTGGALGNLNLIGKRSGQKAGTFCPGTRLQGIGGASERSLRLRSNEVPSGAFKRPSGLAPARWRGLAPTSSNLSTAKPPAGANLPGVLLCLRAGYLQQNRHKSCFSRCF